MKEIKSVRVRRSSVKSTSLDIKVILYEDSNDRILIGTNNDNPVWLSTRYKRSGIYKEYTDSQFIDSFISTNSKIDGNKYEIIQDPWESKPPTFRNYGFDPYYLNNGAEIYISWRNEEDITEGGKKYSDNEGKEVLEQQNNKTIIKSIRILHKEESKIITLNNNGDFESTISSKDFRVLDSVIIDIIIEKWKNKIPNYDLQLCLPNNESCYIIPYKSPINTFVEDYITTIRPINENVKELITVILPESVKTKIDTTFKIFIGKNKELEVNQNSIQDDELTDLSDEYIEGNFAGLEEEELKLQEEVASGQENSDLNLVEAGSPANIRPFNNLDSLLRLAGECARELGKSPKVNYKNLSSSYIKGIHGLCPQGTLAVLYALTGVKKVGTIRGNANTFSINGNNSFKETGYFNSKVRISKDYFESQDKWQIGDVVAVDYTGGKPYGHIQVWTGFKWMSDFTQNKLQIANVDWNSVALHRMNERGVDAVRKQSQVV